MQPTEPLTFVERADYDQFVSRIRRRTGIDLSRYREPQMWRRLRSMVMRSGRSTFAEYADLLESDPADMSAFVDRITIHVSELFRNPEMWKSLQERLLPGLLTTGRPLKIWSAGCSNGAEPYTIAMILAETAGFPRYTLLATDIDARTLARAAEGLFTEAEVRSMPRRMRERYLAPQSDGQFQIAKELRQRVTFRRHDLLRDGFDSGFDLIVCRNVVIYFTDNAKEELFRRFAASLRCGGILFVGGTERIHQYQELGLASPLPFFYQKPDRAARTSIDGARTAA